MPKLAVKQWFLIPLLLFGYLFAGYFISRTDTALLLSVFILLSGLFYWTYFTAEENTIDQWIKLGVFLRLILLFSIPNLSDDVYRYLWDGRLLANGIHPFSYVPSYFVDNNILPSTLNQELFNKLNSPNYFTIYPPVAQFVFWIAAKIAADNIAFGIIVIRVFIIGAEIGSIYLIRKLLAAFHLPAKNILLYALNPLVILELSGNLHLEAFMIFFLLFSIDLLRRNKWLYSSVFFALAICAKLIPLIFLPVLLLSLKSIKKLFLYGLVVVVTCLLLFIPLFNWDIVTGFDQSFGYYFKKFEFNASIYYLVREWGFWNYGYNIVQTVGWKLGVISGLIIILYSLFSLLKARQQTATNNQQLLADWLWIYGIYLAFTTTLHPWYVVPMLAFSIFTRYRFTVLWSLLVFSDLFGIHLHRLHRKSLDCKR